MSIDVNPNSRASFTDKDGRLTIYGMNVLRKVYDALGLVGDNSDLDNLFNQLISVQQALQDEVYVSTVSSDYTCVDGVNEILEVTAACTITLSSNPVDGEQKTITPTGFFNVAVSGSVNGESSITMKGAYDCMDVVYYVDLDRWVIQ